MKKIPTLCPACNSMLEITELRCPKCSTIIQGEFPMNKLLSLSDEDSKFLIAFLRSRGNIKEVQERMSISYPTVKNRLDKLLITLGLFSESEGLKEKEILDTLERGEITAAEAVKLMKEAKQ
ncbi:MAG: DUF2089 domain-containing protein [Candidatus Caldatribacteriota bacterium]|nr:DUF2089 domain-containing protein [Candidatus Caldatribacteriota bacterium]